MIKLIIITISVVIASGMFVCLKPADVEVMTTNSGTKIANRIFYTNKVAARLVIAFRYLALFSLFGFFGTLFSKIEKRT
jgi:hypothetical protein